MCEKFQPPVAATFHCDSLAQDLLSGPLADSSTLSVRVVFACFACQSTTPSLVIVTLRFCAPPKACFAGTQLAAIEWWFGG